MKIFIVQMSPYSFHFLYLKDKYSTKFHVQKHPKSIFFACVGGRISHPSKSIHVIVFFKKQAANPIDSETIDNNRVAKSIFSHLS
jgi:hypothetical protein